MASDTVRAYKTLYGPPESVVKDTLKIQRVNDAEL